MEEGEAWYTCTCILCTTGGKLRWAMEGDTRWLTTKGELSPEGVFRWPTTGGELAPAGVSRWALEKLETGGELAPAGVSRWALEKLETEAQSALEELETGGELAPAGVSLALEKLETVLLALEKLVTAWSRVVSEVGYLLAHDLRRTRNNRSATQQECPSGLWRGILVGLRLEANTHWPTAGGELTPAGVSQWALEGDTRWTTAGGKLAPTGVSRWAVEGLETGVDTDTVSLMRRSVCTCDPEEGSLVLTVYM